MKYSALLLLVIALPALLASCSQPAYQARGYASHIAEQYAGHYTTSGSIYQPLGWTAAHNTLPFGTVVKVKNNANGRTVNVTVNDRFPYYQNRVINLSRAAAQEIQIPYHQLADVTVTAHTVAGGAAPASHYTAPPANYGYAQSSYSKPISKPAPVKRKAPAHTAYKAPTPKTYHAPAVKSTSRKPSTVPPAGYGTSIPPAGYGTRSLPAGIPPPPPGYR